MKTQNQPQDWQGAYNSTIKMVWYLIAFSIVLSFIGAMKISYDHDGNIVSFVSPIFYFIVMMISAVTTVGCFIGTKIISGYLPKIATDEEILSHVKDVHNMRGITIASLMTFLLFFAITPPVGQFIPVLLENRIALSIFTCVPILLAFAVFGLKFATRIRHEYLTPQR